MEAEDGFLGTGVCKASLSTAILCGAPMKDVLARKARHILETACVGGVGGRGLTNMIRTQPMSKSGIVAGMTGSLTG